jgi:ClpP class serine protease
LSERTSSAAPATSVAAVQSFAMALAEHLDALGARNHVAWSVAFPAFGGKPNRRLDFVAHWEGGLTTADRIGRAEAERDKALADLAAARKADNDFRASLRPVPLACSAAYGLACAADRILVTEDGTVGSVGCIAVVTDRTAQNAQNGLARTVIASGTAKADGHPDQPQTSAALSRMRARVMQLAGMFQGWVAARRSLTPEAVVAMQGAAIYGADAVAKGLADSVGTLADAIATAEQRARAALKVLQEAND